MLVMVMLGTIIAPAVAATPGDNDIHVTRIVVEPAGPDMNFTIYYESSFFTRVFSIIFGAKVLQPPIEHLFANFTNVSIVSIDSNNNVARLTIKDMSRLNDAGWYVYDGDDELASPVDSVEVHNSDGQVITASHTNKLPVISSRLPSLGP